MVCPRCISAVQKILNDLNINVIDVRLGEVILSKEVDSSTLEQIRNTLSIYGFELLDDKQQQTIEQIKAIIIDQIHYSEDKGENISEVLTDHLCKDYSTLSKLFSTVEGVTIEQFTILQRIEKVKELISYNQKNLNEIAFEMRYSSVAHLSAQFKKITGLTPSQFKAQGILLRKGLDEI